MNTQYKKNILILFSVVCTLYFVFMIRIATISEYSRMGESAQTVQTKSIILSTERAPIYDRNQRLITNTATQTKAVIFGGINNLSTLKYYFKSGEYAALSEQMEQRGYAVANIRATVTNPLTISHTYRARYCENQPACHLVGYLRDGVGVVGLEKALNDYFVQNSSTATVSFQTDAVGSPVIPINAAKIINNQARNGVHLTIDLGIQDIVQRQLEDNITSGAACVVDMDSCEILALASYPTFDQKNISPSLNRANSPLLNKSLVSYSVGSVFKPIIAAAALEAGFDPSTVYECSGGVTINDTTFKCHKLSGHGKINLMQAIAQSCNCYFVNLIQTVNEEYLLHFLSLSGFGKEVSLAPNYSSTKGNLPTLQQMTSGDIYNISFGQGKLQANILQITAAISALCNGGEYRQLKLITGIDNYMGQAIAQNSFRLCSSNTANIIKQAMVKVVEEGTGKRAKPEKGRCGGKTATAQTGVFKDGIELTHGWFSGFYEIDDRRYIITIFSENGGEGSAVPAAVFKGICDNISCLTNG